MQAEAQSPAGDEETSSGAAVRLAGVARTYGRGKSTVHALDAIDLAVAPGEAVGIVGASGCGKSTLLELICGLQEPDRGTASVAGEQTAAGRRDACSFMPQRDLLLPWRDALGNAALALEAQGVRAREARRRAQPLLERFGLAGFAGTRPAALSGGMRQRVAFMRTLLPGRPVLALDEPFAALDAITRADMQQWLSETLAAEPRTVVLVTHDVEEALFICDRVVILGPRPGRVVAELDVPMGRPRDRRAAVTDPEFARLREQALEALSR